MEAELGNQIFFKNGDIKAGGDVHRDILKRRIIDLKKEGRLTKGEVEALKNAGRTASALLALSTTSLGGAMAAFVTWMTITEDEMSQVLLAACVILIVISIGFGIGFYKYGYSQRLEETISTRDEVKEIPTILT